MCMQQQCTGGGLYPLMAHTIWHHYLHTLCMLPIHCAATPIPTHLAALPLQWPPPMTCHMLPIPPHPTALPHPCPPNPLKDSPYAGCLHCCSTVASMPHEPCAVTHGMAVGVRIACIVPCWKWYHLPVHTAHTYPTPEDGMLHAFGDNRDGQSTIPSDLLGTLSCAMEVAWQ